MFEVEIKDGIITVNDEVQKLDASAMEVAGVKIKGRNAFGNEEFEEFFTKYLVGMNDYIEIGTLFGASACLAGLNCKGEVHCIDPLNGYYSAGKRDQSTGMLPFPSVVRENWDIFGLDQKRLHIHQHKHPPFPESIKDKRFDVGYIDGDHRFEGCWADWDALKDRVDKFIIFDNYEKEDVKAVVQMAVRTSEWAIQEKQKGFEIYAIVLRRET